jgi:queuine tRNA-ribosyltransferase
MFRLIKTDKNTKARRGLVTTGRGTVPTPFFMPVATNGTLKSLTLKDIEEIDADILLSNTYHLYLRPGMEIIEAAGGLHKFMNWTKPVLTDSGGYQIFSLTKFRKLTDEGVKFRSHQDGSLHLLTPEDVCRIQGIIGSDLIMPLDVCAPYPCTEKEAKKAVERTTLWAKRSKEYFMKHNGTAKQKLFGIVQGAIYKDLRLRSVEEILKIGFDGYAIGGVSVGEPVKDMFETLEWVIPKLPAEKPRYFMGIGLPDQIVKAVGEGVDMFDTVIPTRYGRHGAAFTRKGKLNLGNANFAKDFSPIDAACTGRCCRQYTRAYLRHLLNQNEITGLHIISYHNVYFYVNLMREIRKAIDEDRYEAFEKEFLSEYGSELEKVER